MVAAAVGAMAVFTGGFLVGTSSNNAPRVERIAIPAPQVSVSVPAQPAPMVQVHTPPPAPAAPVVVEKATPPPRPVAPRLWAQCMALGFKEETPIACAWDNGLPAISADGTRIATEYVPDDGGRGNPGLTIRLVDARSGRLAREVVIFKPDEYVEDTGDGSPDVVKLRAKIAARVKVAQRVFADGGYRTMAVLGGSGTTGEPDESTRNPNAIYAEVDGGAVRVIDPATNTVIWQHELGVPSPWGQEASDTNDCGGWQLLSNHLWWDPTTRVVLARLAYRTGGCMCHDETVERVARIPRVE